MEQIEEAGIEVEQEGIFLRLEGDFTRTFQRYLSEDPEVNRNTVFLNLPRNVVEALYKDLVRVLAS